MRMHKRKRSGLIVSTDTRNMLIALSLGKEQNVCKVVRLIKEESPFWINRSELTNRKFIWQDDYWAVGVSESHLDSVRKYICSQEEHYRKVSFEEEIDKLMKKMGGKG